MKNCGTSHDHQGSWVKSGYNSCYGMHPPWAGINHNFDEWVLKDESKCVIRGIDIRGEIDGDLYMPNGFIRMRGNVTIKGNLHIGTITFG